MTTKKHCILLFIIIPAKKLLTEENFDDLWSLFWKKLHQGWSDGVQVRSTANYCGKITFDCHFMSIFTIHNFPTLGILNGCVAKDYVGCPCCCPTLKSRTSKVLKKNLSYNRHPRW